MQPLTLYQLNSLVRETLETTFPETFLVTGELSEARQASNGHFYGELIEKGADGKSVVARARINCWARQYNLLRMRFLHETGQDIRAGLSVMLMVQVTYHEAYGLSLNVLDIDSSYSLGTMERRRKEILAQLEADGILEDNRTLALPKLARRVAVVSAATAAGYGDFCHHLQHNDYGLGFCVKLFPAVMQGQHVEESVMAALQQIADEYDRWDVAVIIRGGGAVADLADFDSYPLAASIAQFPLPVLVGIGHERDKTVLDYVAHRCMKTPTAVADFLIEHQAQCLVALEQFARRVRDAVRDRVYHSRQRLNRLAFRLPSAVGRCTLSHHHRLKLLEGRIQAGAGTALQTERHRTERLATLLPNAAALLAERHRHRLDMIEQKVQLCDPARILRQGYSLTTVEGRIVTDASQVKPGDVLKTRLAHGELTSRCCENESPQKE